MNSEYAFHAVNSQEDTVQKIEKEYDPLPLTRRGRERIIEEEGLARYNQLGYEIKFPEHYPPYRQFLAADDGSIIARIYRFDAADTAYCDIFDQEGYFVTALAVLIFPASGKTTAFIRSAGIKKGMSRLSGRSWCGSINR